MRIRRYGLDVEACDWWRDLKFQRSIPFLVSSLCLPLWFKVWAISWSFLLCLWSREKFCTRSKEKENIDKNVSHYKKVWDRERMENFRNLVACSWPQNTNCFSCCCDITKQKQQKVGGDYLGSCFLNTSWEKKTRSWCMRQLLALTKSDSREVDAVHC